VLVTLHAARHAAWHGLVEGGRGSVRADMAGESIAVTVNGEARQVPAGTTVLALVQMLGLGGRPVAVEKNREVVPRARHADEVLADGDRLELVTFVGGG